MKTIINKVILLVFLALTATACLDDTIIDFGDSPILTQFSESEVNAEFLKNGIENIHDYEVNLGYLGKGGEVLNEDVNVTIAIDPSSTATEGLEFTLPQTTYTIPAGSRSVPVLLKVDTDPLDIDTPVTVVLVITSSSQTVADNNSISITLIPTCPTDLTGTYITNSSYGPWALRTGIDDIPFFTITRSDESPNSFIVSHDNTSPFATPFTISDVCNEITITDGGYVFFGFPHTIQGGGSVDPVTGTISLSFTVTPFVQRNPRELILEKQ